MNEFNNNADALDLNDFEAKKIPQSLNVLTILTYIGCAIFGLLTLLTPWFTKFFLGMMDKAAESGKELSAKELSDMEKGRHAMELTQAHMFPIIAVGLVGIILCFIGAFMMRKLKKDGFWIYVAGQVVPIIGNLAILGTAQFTGVTSYLVLLIPIIFIILYARQRKYLVN